MMVKWWWEDDVLVRKRSTTRAGCLFVGTTTRLSLCDAVRLLFLFYFILFLFFGRTARRAVSLLCG